ncbi:MAG: DASS family sodium-coupled anion symporter [Bowdeniella nasicola]|nr:DASS family sodium-coupled anion symporter [Bowdeniella nasicola]
MRTRPSSQHRLPTFTTRNWVGLIIGVVAFCFPLVFTLPGLSTQGHRMLAIFLLAIVFWVSEAIPLVATAMVVILLEVLLISTSAILPVDESALPASDYYAALAHPVIILFLGGFLLAYGAAKYGLDRNLAAVMLRPFQGSGRLTVLGLMLISALLSMFMSNTATTATMFAVVIPILAVMPTARSRAGLALAIPVAANIGGIGTPVGTPPNAIAIGALADAGIHVSFLQWMVFAVPLMLVVLAFGWWLIVTMFIPPATPVELHLDPDFDQSVPARIFYIVAGLTVVLWMSEPIHGISASTVGLIPVAILLATGVVGAKELGELQWSVLWLVSGGIALGVGVGASELDAWLLGSVNWAGLPAMVLIAALALLGLGMSNVISHSAAANLLVPLTLTLGTASAAGSTQLTIIVALACSLGMALPISTPPNAIAYATGEVPVKHMGQVGILVGLFGTLLLALAMPTVLGWLV